VSLGDESFSDLDYTDDVALLAEMLEVLILSLEIMQEEAILFGLKINWCNPIRDIPGPELLRRMCMCSHVTLAFSLPGIEHRTKMLEADLCRQLCPSLGSALDDDDDGS